MSSGGETYINSLLQKNPSFHSAKNKNTRTLPEIHCLFTSTKLSDLTMSRVLRNWPRYAEFTSAVDNTAKANFVRFVLSTNIH